MQKGNISGEDVGRVRAELTDLVVTWECGDYTDEIVEMIIVDYVFSKSEYVSGKALELAELIAFLRGTKGKSVLLSEVVADKYLPLSSATIGVSIIRECEKWATTLLNELRGDKYEIMGIPHKELDDFDVISYVEPYTDNELAQILSFEREMREVREIYSPRMKYANKDEFRNQYYGRILKKWHDFFAEMGMFKSAEYMKRGGAERKGYRQECVCLYDCMAIIELFKPIEANGEDESHFVEEKYNKVRNCIDSYEKHILKKQAARKSE
ncbi:hypothetical protein LJC45_02690 [Alistipes sp. OttesenSCG-928-B03]|nr:hypothetical protein [Alistipes sp. OttesenSCG-928-B03]